MNSFYQQNRAGAEEYGQNLSKNLSSLIIPEQFYEASDTNSQKFYLEYKNRVGGFVAETTEKLYQELRISDNSHLLLLKRSALVDAVIRTTLWTAVWLYNQKHSTRLDLKAVPLAIVACGGYGREEMYFASDVDIRIISRILPSGETDEIVAEVGRYFEYLLVHQDIFRIKCKFGFTEAKGKEGRIDAGRMASFYSLMENRWVAGEVSIFQEFREAIKVKTAQHQHEIIDYCITRKSCYEVQNTVFQQEPNVKEEMRRLYWALCLTRIKYSLEKINLFELLHELYTKEKLSVPTFKNMQKALNFLSRVRLILHCCQKGYQRDLMSFEVRDKILESMGLPLKQFFQEYFYNAVYPLKRYSRNLFLECITPDTKIAKTLEGGFAIDTENQIVCDRSPEDMFSVQPEMAFKIFTWVAEEGCNLSYPIIRAIENNISNMYPIFMGDERGREISSYFQSIIEGRYFSKALRLLHEFGLVSDYFIPEFKNLCGLLQDIYVHQFPTDIHILSALDELNRLTLDKTVDPFLAQLYESVKDKTALKLSVLLHDIGKGLKKPGEDEELIGSRQIPHILKNLGYNDARKTEDVAFLVEKHLTMRDLMLLDPDEDDTYEMIWDLVEDRERLKMLILLTYADRGGTKMKMSTSQIEQLKLFHQNTLHHKKYSSVPNAIKLEFLEMIRLPRDMQQQLDVYNEFTDSAENFAAEMLLKSGQPSELVVCAKDYKGLLFHIAVVLAFNRLNIVDANVHTLGDKVFDVFKVLSSSRKPIDLGEYYLIQKQIKEDLRRIFIKKEPLSQIYKGRTLPDRPEAGKYKEVKLRHKIIGRAIKLESLDILGTFMMTTKVFSELGLEIQKAVLHTHQGTASNVFYFNHRDMEQILEKKEKFIEKIQEALGQLLKAEPIFL